MEALPTISRSLIGTLIPRSSYQNGLGCAEVIAMLVRVVGRIGTGV